MSEETEEFPVTMPELSDEMWVKKLFCIHCKMNLSDKKRITSLTRINFNFSFQSNNNSLILEEISHEHEDTKGKEFKSYFLSVF